MKTLEKTQTRLARAEAAQQVDITKIGKAFTVLHTPEGEKWKAAKLTLGGQYFDEKQSLAQLWRRGTPEELFKILYESTLGTKNLPQVIELDEGLWGYHTKQDTSRV